MSLKKTETNAIESEKLLEIIDANGIVSAEIETENDANDKVNPIADSPEGIGFKIIKTAIKLPGTKVNREEFLRDILKEKVSPEVLDNAVKNGTSEAGISLEIVQKLAKECILSTKMKSTAMSAATGLPGGFVGTTAGLAADVTQFYANLIILIQKLVYLYGMKEIGSYADIKNYDDEYANIISFFIGAAMGIEGASAGIKFYLKGMEKKYAAQAGKLILLSKPLFYNIAKKVAKTVGISLSKKSFAKLAAKSVPVISAETSAILNWITFEPLANRLNKQLSAMYGQSFDLEKELAKLKKTLDPLVDSKESIKKYGKSYHKNVKLVKNKKRDNLSQECISFIKELCDAAYFCKPDENIFNLVNVNKDDCFVCHDDTKKSHSRGFVITSEGIHSYIDKKKGYRFISFKELTEITGFNPDKQHKYIEGRKGNVEILPILPYEKTNVEAKTVVRFLYAIRNACWVDLYM